jgi:hypothetical protein
VRVNRARFGALLTIFLLPFSIFSCHKSESPLPGPQASNVRSDILGSEVLSPGGFSNEAAATSGQLVLPTSFGRQTGDLDHMLQVRNLRALVTISPISFFYAHGKPRGLLYEQLEQLQRFVNGKSKGQKTEGKGHFHSDAP